MNNYFKYPRTFHLPWSDSVASDDKKLHNVEHLMNKEVVISLKMDGENTSMYNDHIHARSLDSKNHPSRDWVKQFHASIKNDIPDGWRICGENLYAKHSIEYNNLKSYFYGFSIWNEHNVCLDWNTTIEWFNLLNIIPIEVFYIGPFKSEIHNIFTSKYNTKDVEGYVVRLKDSFSYTDFSKSVAKYVRRNHVQTDEHWMNSTIVTNKLKI